MGVFGSSFICDYKDETGIFRRLGVYEVRAWRYNTELIELPPEAVTPDGKLHVRIGASKRHSLGFIGFVPELQKMPRSSFQEEKLPLTHAYHTRTGHDATKDLQSREEGGYVGTIPGDTVDVDFQEPKLIPGTSERETYLIRSSGFYTSLRPENRVRAGNWKEKLSPEARERAESLIALKDYS